jgi:uncharacterized protein (DUF983 family)
VRNPGAALLPDNTSLRWPPERKPALPPPPSLATALGRGFTGYCPVCGKTHLFRGYLTVVAVCSYCGTPLGLARADDAPPYFTILVVGHIVIPSMVILERSLAPPLLVQAAIWVPLTVALTLGLLRPIKGATVGLMLRLGMLKSDPDA